MSSASDITQALKRWTDNPEAVVNELTPTVYRELRKIAAAYLGRERPDHTLQPTALINEAYLRLVDLQSADIADRTHFYVLAARMMRRILVDAARAHQAAKRGFGNKVSLNDSIEVGDGGRAWNFLALHEALEKLQGHNARTAQAVELRYFGGLQLEEIAEGLSVSLATVKRDLAFGEAWLRRALSAHA
jgi:RNA polymerase sigma factor (TIGR02999 family)